MDLRRAKCYSLIGKHNLSVDLYKKNLDKLNHLHINYYIESLTALNKFIDVINFFEKSDLNNLSIRYDLYLMACLKTNKKTIDIIGEIKTEESNIYNLIELAILKDRGDIFESILLSMDNSNKKFDDHIYKKIGDLLFYPGLF